MIDYYLQQNIIQWTSQSIALNDLLRCQDVDAVDPTDIKQRYLSTDPFYKHVEDTIYSQIHSDFLYPFIAIEYGGSGIPIAFNCDTDINIQFTVLVKHCTPETCEDCQISINDPRYHMNLIMGELAKMFRFDKTDSNGIVSTTNIFKELLCTEQTYYDCDTEETITADWKYNVIAQLANDPILSPMVVRSDGIVEQILTIPLHIESVCNEIYCVDGCIQCTM